MDCIRCGVKYPTDNFVNVLDDKTTLKYETCKNCRRAEIPQIVNRECKRCHELKPVSDFSSVVNGNRKSHIHCEECRITAKARYNENRNNKLKEQRDKLKDVPIVDSKYKYCTTCRQEQPLVNFIDPVCGKERKGCYKCREYYRILNAKRRSPTEKYAFVN